MEIKKKAKFRVICKELATKKHRTFTVYDDANSIKFEKFVEKVSEMLKNF